jgi:cyclopropane fatty-acyl-phospholipid synthase-like methyltransferase
LGLNEVIFVLGLLLVLLGIVLLFILWTSFRGAPWFPTSLANVRKMLAMADVQPGEVVYDLGSGDGRVIIMAARRFGARAVGIEIDPLRYLWTRMLITVLGLQGEVRVVWGDFFDQDLSQADVVTVYLLQKTNTRLMDKLRRELRPGARVVSNTFIFPGWALARKDSEAQLYMYKM